MKSGDTVLPFLSSALDEGSGQMNVPATFSPIPNVQCIGDWGGRSDYDAVEYRTLPFPYWESNPAQLRTLLVSFGLAVLD
jgi:hypothetical protein